MTQEPTLEELKKEATSTLKSVRSSLEGLLIELRGAQRRSFDTSDFTIEEFRRLTRAIERLTDQLEKHK